MKTKMVALIAAVMMMASAAWAAAGDTSALHPPAGSRMALVVFEDLQCPACARAEPLLEQAARNYHLPLVRHDFIIPIHTWSKEAHIIARYFDAHSTAQSPQLGEEFRASVFASQSAIYNKEKLREFADKFAAAHHTALPAFYDPTGELRAKVEADTQLGRVTGETGVIHTPTIYVVSDSKQMPYLEVKDTEKLFDTIEQVKAALGPAGKTIKKTQSRSAVSYSANEVVLVAETSEDATSDDASVADAAPAIDDAPASQDGGDTADVEIAGVSQ
jgi:protein-disulfide isomerase